MGREAAHDTAESEDSGTPIVTVFLSAHDNFILDQLLPLNNREFRYCDLSTLVSVVRFELHQRGNFQSSARADGGLLKANSRFR